MFVGLTVAVQVKYGDYNWSKEKKVQLQIRETNVYFVSQILISKSLKISATQDVFFPYDRSSTTCMHICLPFVIPFFYLYVA